MRSESQRNAILVAALVVLTAGLVGILLPLATGNGQPAAPEFTGLPTRTPTPDLPLTPFAGTTATPDAKAETTPSVASLRTPEATEPTAELNPAPLRAVAAAPELTPVTPAPLRTMSPGVSPTAGEKVLRSVAAASPVVRFATETPAPLRTNTPTNTRLPGDSAPAATGSQASTTLRSAPAPTRARSSAPAPAPTRGTTSPPADALVVEPVPLLWPASSETVRGKVRFEWQALPILPYGVAYEVVWWNRFEEPSAARGFAPPTWDTRLTIDLDVLYRSHQFADQTIYWTVLPVRVDPYERLVQPGSTPYRFLLYDAPGGGSQPEPSPPPPR